MRVFLYVITYLLLFTPCLVEAYDVLVIQDQRSPIYDTVLLGFRSAHHFKERLIVLKDYAENDLVRITREDHPTLVLAVGGRALAESHVLHQTPVVSVFSYGIQQSDPPSNQVQVKMLAQADQYAALFRALRAKRVGTVLSPNASKYAARATEAFRQAGIHLIVREAIKHGDVPKQIETLKNNVDALWLLPNPAIVTSETVEAFEIFSLEHRLPLVSFSEAHLKKGAVAAFAIDLADLGKQAAEVANRIMNGVSPVDFEEITPRKLRLRFNRKTLEYLGLPIEPLQHLGGSAAE